MTFKKEKNGILITVENWSNNITLTEKTTGKIIKQLPFSNHVNAVFFAKKLTSNN